MDLKRIFDQLGTSDPNNFDGLAAFDQVQAAEAWTPLPAGKYKARVVSGSVTQTKKGDTAYRVVFEITEGEQRSKRLSRLWTFTEKSLKFVKRDLGKLNLTSMQKLLEPFPPVGKEYIVGLIVALQRMDDGTETNDIKQFVVLEIKDTPGSDFLIDPNRPASSEGGTNV